MAIRIRNRKLFPNLSSNDTTYCADFCDPTCPYYNCPEADFYFSPPPPSLPPPPPPSAGVSSSISPSLITAVSLLGGFFILLGYYVIIRKNCFHRRTRNNHLPPPPDVGNEEFLDENRMDHPIWFITTVGLQQSIINAITACKYRKGEGLIEGSECSVCLNDFQEGEMLRLLPKCSHAFHVRCIDTWLRSHTNCPLCRANIVAPTVAEHSISRAQMEPVERLGEDLDATREARMEDSRENGGLEENLDQDRDIGNREQTGELQGEVIGEVASKDRYTRKEIMLEEIESARSSVSHSIPDSSSSCSASSEQQIYVEVPKSSESTDGLKIDAGANKLLKTGAAAGSSSIGRSAAPIVRSHSCGSGFFLSRHSRNSSSILPF